MAIKAWGPLFALLMLAGVAGLFVEHPKPYDRSQPTVTPYQNSHSDELAATHSSNQHGQKGEQERSWIEGLFDKPTDTLLVSFNGLLVLFTYFLYSATSGLFKETAELRRIADEQRVDLSRSIIAAEKAADAAKKSAEAAVKSADIATKSQEAHLALEEVETTWGWDRDRLNEIFIFQGVFKNVGNTAARNAKALIGFHTTEIGIRIDTLFEGIVMDVNFGVTVGSGVPIRTATMGMKSDLAKEIWDKKKRCLIRIWAQYETVFSAGVTVDSIYDLEIKAYKNPYEFKFEGVQNASIFMFAAVNKS
jgi:hypothetical protein